MERTVHTMLRHIDHKRKEYKDELPRFVEQNLIPPLKITDKEKKFIQKINLFTYVLEIIFIYGENGNIKFKVAGVDNKNKKVIESDTCFSVFFHSLFQIQKEVC